jgi:HAD superfamily hydrolase (TIGR01450 family)
MAKRLYRGILADLDGTVNRGRLLIEGADHVYKELSRKGVRWVFVSNSATSLASHLAQKLRQLGLPVSEDQVVNSAAALIRVLKQEYDGAPVMVVGEPRLVEGVRAAGNIVTEDPQEAEIVISALDRGFTYEKLKRAHQAIQRGARFWATNLDATFPSAEGFLPGAGSVVASIITAAGRPPDRVFGKPSPDMAFLALEVLELPPEECLVVGDRMETDVVFAQNAGMDSALVLTGASTRDQLKDSPQLPRYVFDSIVDVASLFG